MSNALHPQTERTLVASRVGPDLDGYGGAYGYAELLRLQGHDAVAVLFGVPHDEVQVVLKDRGIAPLAPADDLSLFGKIVLVGVSEPRLLDSRIDIGLVTEIIDHRAEHEAQRFVNATSQIELVGAVATLVAERFRNANAFPSAEAAMLLWGGILMSTMNFRAPATTVRDREMASWLSAIAELPADDAVTISRTLGI